MEYKTLKAKIYTDIAQMIKDAKRAGWPYRVGDFATGSTVEESNQINEIIDETYWEIRFRKNAIGEI